MPRGNRTGPAGMGPMTGRVAGYCAGYPVPGYMNPIPGRTVYYSSAPAPYGAGSYGYRAPYLPYYAGSFSPRFGRGYWFGFGRGFGRGRGRFVY